MEIEYGNNKIKKELSGAREILKSYGNMAKKVVLRLDQIKASPNLLVLMQLPSVKCHPLAGNKKGEWAVSISGNHRLIFEIADDPIPYNEDNSVDFVKVTTVKIIRTEDYH